ncbi:MAG TPA: ABC transporter substrate-binding protein [Anaerolineales bacterium]|nr:ABC transporter substrate-binding protein [Anaerolineales bacterium]
MKQQTSFFTWKTLLLAIFTTLLVMLSACGSAPQTAPTESPQAEATAGGTLKVGLLSIINTDPAQISSDSEVFLANAVYDYLVDVDAQNNITPRLASEWQTSEDGLTWTFTLVSTKFHDGSDLTPADVVWTFDRLRNPDNGFPTSDLYKNIESIRAEGNSSVVFVLSQSNPFFLYDLSDSHALVLKAETSDFSKFNGTGPFVVKTYTAEDRVILERNANYFLSGQPKLDGAELVIFSEDNAMIDALRGGQIDLMMRMATAQFKALQSETGILTYNVPTNGFDMVRLRADREPGNNPLVQQALKLATDREAIRQVITQGLGAPGSDTPIGPLYAQYYVETSLPARDAEKAKALLAEAGYPDGLNLTLHVPDSGDRPNLAAVLKEQWAEAGINIEISVEPESVYFADEGWLGVDLGITNWGSRPYPQFYLDTMLTSNAVWNEAHYANPKLDELAVTGGTTLDENARKQAYAEIQTLLQSEGPLIIPYFFAQYAASSDRVQGFELKAFAGRSDLRMVSLK